MTKHKTGTRKESQTQTPSDVSMKTKTPFTGGCLCGAVRYECTAETVQMLECHCADCQHFTGGAGMSGVIVPTKAVFVVKGAPRFYSAPSSAGGNIHRGFCSDCGSPVLAKFDRAPHVYGIPAGSLDDPSWFQPQVYMWTSDAQPWHQMDPAVPKYPEYPPFTTNPK